MQFLIVAFDIHKLIVRTSLYNLTFVQYANFIAILDSRVGGAPQLWSYASHKLIKGHPVQRRSLSVSRADVASSRMRIGGFLRIARAILTR